MTPLYKVCSCFPALEQNSRKPAQPRQEITITLPDGAERKGTSWETSPMDVAKGISKSLSEKLVIAKVLVSSRDQWVCF